MKSLVQRLQRLVAVAAIVAAALTATESFAGEAAEGAKFDTVPMTIANKSGYRGKMFVFVYGMSEDNTWYRVINKQGDVAPFPDTSAYKAYGINFKNKKKARIRLPKLMSGRVYISYDKKLKFSSPGAEPSPPKGWSASDKNYKTLFDRFEYNWFPQTGLPIDAPLPANSTALEGELTQSDMIGIPMLFAIKGVGEENEAITMRAGFGTPGTRDKIMTDMRKAGYPWNKLVIEDGRRRPLRAISPYNGIGAKLFPSDQLDSYIDQVWNKYAGSKMTAVLQGDQIYRYTGKVSGGKLVFTSTIPGSRAVSFAKPTSLQIYEGPTPPPIGGTGSNTFVLELLLQATFMRSTILADGDISACPDPAAYYKNTPVNMYAKILHQYAYLHRAFAFEADDVCVQASGVAVYNPTSVRLKIPKFERKKRR
jgi:Beta-1,3-glucanase